MTDNLIGKRVRATLGENVLVGEVDRSGVAYETTWYEISVTERPVTVWMDANWTIEPLPEPLPTAPYSLVVPPAERSHIDSSYILEPTEDGPIWWNQGSHYSEDEVQQAIADGWRVIPGPAE